MNFLTNKEDFNKMFKNSESEHFFMFAEDFKGKRFNRYMEKVIASITESFNKIPLYQEQKNFDFWKFIKSIILQHCLITDGFYDEEYDEECDDDDIEVSPDELDMFEDFEDFDNIDIFSSYDYFCEKDSLDDFDFLLKQLDSYFINDIDFPHEYDDNHIKSNFVATDNAKIKFDNGTSITFKELMKKEFENTCIDYLYINSLYNADFCLDGYFVSIPKNHKEVVLFINLFVRRLFIDVDRLFQSVQTSDKIINTSLQNENNKQKKRN